MERVTCRENISMHDNPGLNMVNGIPKNQKGIEIERPAITPEQWSSFIKLGNNPSTCTSTHIQHAIQEQFLFQIPILTGCRGIWARV